ncbi:MAG: hypothetical protein EOP72_05590 [Variovorax sp.]|jgi:hypothetical protein|nr:MAG: hypothetical protein EOP72_05590 [Variovorax sp.]
MTTSFSSTSPAAGALRALSADRERHRSVFASQGDDAERKRFALPDPASPDYEASLAALEGEIDRASARLDRQDEAKDQAQAERQLAESEDDPAPLSNYKRAEAIKQDTP